MKKSMRGEGAGMQEGETEGGIEREREQVGKPEERKGRGKKGEARSKRREQKRTRREGRGRGERTVKSSK